MACLIAGGDSFTFGSELQGCIDRNHKKIPSPNSYASLIAQETKLDYCCVAYPGYSNDAITRTVINECSQQKDIGLVIVCWTFPGRYEFRIAEDWRQISHWSAKENIEEIIDKEFQNENNKIKQSHLYKLRQENEGIQLFAKSFYQYVGDSEYTEVYTSLINIIRLQHYLDANRIPYLFTAVDQNLIKNIERHLDDLSISVLYNQISHSKWFWFPGNLGFYTWSLENKFPIGTTHPLEPAHNKAAELINEHLRNISRIS